MNAGSNLKVAFIGAGSVNFGRGNLPWDHATRLEKIGGVSVIAIVDSEIEKAEHVLQIRRSSVTYGHIYKDCKVLVDLHELIAVRPDAVFIGIPPFCRGSPENGRDIELCLVKSGIHVFVEKPLSVIPMEVFQSYVDAVTDAAKRNNVIVSVGYMFRYHAAILRIKELIQEHGGKVMAFNARYMYAYPEGESKYWYNKDISGGPIVEQATHFCDLARYLAGNIDLGSVVTIVLSDTDKSGAGNLAHIPLYAEEDIPPGKRIPRVTFSNWRFQDGGVGALMHSIALPGTRYESYIDIQLDGLKLSLIEPYEKSCILRVRSMNNCDPNTDVEYTFEDDDCYHTELRTFLDAIRTCDQTLIKSSYSDAALTYEMTWAIRRTGEENQN